MVYKVTPKELQGRKDEFVIVDVLEADELEEEGKMDGAVNMPLGELIRKARHGDLNDLKGNKTVLNIDREFASSVIDKISHTI